MGLLKQMDLSKQTDLSKQMDFSKLHTAAEKASKLLKVLCNNNRLILLCQMTQGELSVSELETITSIQQPTLSQQLTVLRLEGLVNTRREGKQIFYSIASDDAFAVIQVLYQLYCPEQ